MSAALEFDPCSLLYFLKLDFLKFLFRATTVTVKHIYFGGNIILAILAVKTQSTKVKNLPTIYFKGTVDYKRQN